MEVSDIPQHKSYKYVTVTLKKEDGSAEEGVEVLSHVEGLVGGARELGWEVDSLNISNYS